MYQEQCPPCGGSARQLLLTILLTASCLFAARKSLDAAIVATGNVEPDITTWGSTTTGYVGRTSNGSVRVDAGSVLASSSSYIGYNAGVIGAATVTGMGSRWTSSNYPIHVGFNGNGTLNIEAGGQVSSSAGSLATFSGSSGAATISGAGSKWNIISSLDVGSRGSATLIVENGGEVVSSSGQLGLLPDSSGVVAVTGTGSKWTNSAFFQIGEFGNGELRIQAGGQVSNSTGIVGGVAGSSGTVSVTGTGSKWTNTSRLDVGRSGSGMLTVEAGRDTHFLTNYSHYRGHTLR